LGCDSPSKMNFFLKSIPRVCCRFRATRELLPIILNYSIFMMKYNMGHEIYIHIWSILIFHLVPRELKILPCNSHKCKYLVTCRNQRFSLLNLSPPDSFDTLNHDARIFAPTDTSCRPQFESISSVANPINNDTPSSNYFYR